MPVVDHVMMPNEVYMNMKKILLYVSYIGHLMYASVLTPCD